MEPQTQVTQKSKRCGGRVEKDTENVKCQMFYKGFEEKEGIPHGDIPTALQ